MIWRKSIRRCGFRGKGKAEVFLAQGVKRMNGIAEIKEEICRIGRRMYERRMVASNDGNISARLSDGTILCTPTGVSKGFMTADMICHMNMDGTVREENAKGFRPSSEMKMHLRVYQERSDVGAVVHAHPVFATTFAVARKPLKAPITAESVMFLGEVPVTSFAAPSTEEVPESIVPFVKEHNAMLLANHGALTFDRDLLSAYHKMEAVEFYAELLYRSGYAGTPVELTAEEKEKILGLV